MDSHKSCSNNYGHGPLSSDVSRDNEWICIALALA
jgi:hypothetical protein